MRINPDHPAGRSSGGTSEVQASTAESRPSKRSTGAADLEALLDLVDQAPGDAADDDSALYQHAAQSKRDGGAGKVIKAYQFAQQQGIDLTPRDLARALGEAPEPPMVRLGQAVKDRLPVLTSRSQKLDELGKEMRRVADEAKKDRFTYEQLSTWFSSLSPQERAQVTVAPVFDGVGSWMQPLGVWVGSDRTKIFNAGHLMNLPREVIEALPAETREWLTARCETYQAYGVNTGTQAQQFLNTHFQITPILLGEELPRELARLCELEPALPEKLHSLQQHGLTMHWVSLKQSPDAVLDAVSKLNQRAFISNWLPGLIDKGIPPKQIVADFENIAKAHAKTYRKAMKGVESGTLEAQLIETRLAEELSSRLDYVGNTNLIREFSQEVMGIVLTGGGPEQHAELKQVNEAIHEYFGKQWAWRRVRSDYSNRVSESVREVFKTLLGVSPAGEIAQRVFKLRGLANFIVSSVDNMIAEKGALGALSEAGVPTADLVKRGGFLSLVVAGDAELSQHIDDISRMFGEHAGGAAYSLSAVMLPLFTIPFTVWYFAGQYRQLAREGKLPDGEKLSDRDLARLEELASKQWLIDSVSSALDGQKADPAARDAIIETIGKMEIPAVNMNPEASEQRIGRGEALAKGLKELALVDPTAPLMLGVASGSILFGAAAGPLFLHDPTLEAFAGAFEVPLTLALLRLVSVVLRHQWNRDVKNQESLGLLGPGTTDAENEATTT